MAAASNNMQNISEKQPFINENNVANNQVSIVPDVPIRIINAARLGSRQKEIIFNMYTKTYKNAGYSQRFNTSAELLNKYPCIYALENNYTRAFLMIQPVQFYNKISASCHNGTPLGKAILMHIRRVLLNQPGIIQEASGAVSWLLRKNKIAPMITDENVIRIAIGLKPQEQLIINPNYDINNKDNQYYRRIKYIEKNGTIQADVKDETLFGTPDGCIFDSNDCNRVCREYIDLSKVQGGKHNRKSYKKRNRMNKTVKKYKKY